MDFAVFFGLDGVLADSECLHRCACRMRLDPLGLGFSRDACRITDSPAMVNADLPEALAAP